MTVETITATAKDDEGKEINAEATYDFGDNLKAATDKFGEEIVFARFRSAARVDLQALIRRNITGKEPILGKALQEAVAKWTPGAAKPRKSKSEKAAEAFDELSDEEKKDLLAQLKKLQASK